MICISKKILCYILIGFLTFSVTSTVYYKSVHAMEWVGGALAFEEALKWLLAVIGITATAGMTDAYWETYGDDFVDYATENGATQTEVAEWQLKACQGIIDKGSIVWQKFKAWALSLISNQSELPSVSDSETWSNIAPIMLSQSLLSGWVYTFNSGGHAQSTYCYSAIMYYRLSDNNAYPNSYPQISFFGTEGVNECKLSTINNSPILYVFKDGSRYRSGYQYQRDSYYNSLNLDNYSSTYDWYALGGITDFSNYGCVTYNMDASSISWGNYVSLGTYATDSKKFDSVTNNVGSLDVISSDGVDEDNPEVTIPMPGVSDSDNEASKDAYQDIIDAINDGTITQDQGVEQIQEILKIVTYDIVTDKVVPPQQNEDGTDKTKDDALKENKENMGFTLGGLEAVFPFCIPFDIYAFMTLLVADPVAPEFDFPIQSVNGQVEEIHVDLEPFEPVAVVVRYCFDFLFIIGLALATRELIGAGGGD